MSNSSRDRESCEPLSVEVHGAGGDGEIAQPPRPAGDASGDQQGLSSLHIGPQVFDVDPDHGPVFVDAHANDEALYFSQPWCALPASLYLHQKKQREIHSIELAIGGNAFRYRAGAGVAPACAGNRGEIEGFSSSSRFRQLRFMNSVDQTKLSANRLWFVTLTYPAFWPPDPRQWKDHVKAFKKRLERAYGRLGVIWKLEPQKRGAPHFHLIIMMPGDMTVGLTKSGAKFYNGRSQPVWAGGHLSDFRRWISRAWFEVVGSGDEKHLHAGTSVEPLESWNGAISYAGKYLGKECCFMDQATGEVLRVGRIWGIWRRELWPIQMQVHKLGEAEWVQMRRLLRRYLEHKGMKLRGEDGKPPRFQWIGDVRSCSAFIPFEIVRRIMASVCWWQSEAITFAELYEHEQWSKIAEDAKYFC